jgi:hypothetical protein
VQVAVDVLGLLYGGFDSKGTTLIQGEAKEMFAISLLKQALRQETACLYLNFCEKDTEQLFGDDANNDLLTLVSGNTQNVQLIAQSCLAQLPAKYVVFDSIDVFGDTSSPPAIGRTAVIHRKLIQELQMVAHQHEKTLLILDGGRSKPVHYPVHTIVDTTIKSLSADCDILTATIRKSRLEQKGTVMSGRFYRDTGMWMEN